MDQDILIFKLHFAQTMSINLSKGSDLNLVYIHNDNVKSHNNVVLQQAFQLSLLQFPFSLGFIYFAL